MWEGFLRVRWQMRYIRSLTPGAHFDVTTLSVECDALESQRPRLRMSRSII